MANLLASTCSLQNSVEIPGGLLKDQCGSISSVSEFIPSHGRFVLKQAQTLHRIETLPNKERTGRADRQMNPNCICQGINRKKMILNNLFSMSSCMKTVHTYLNNAIYLHQLKEWPPAKRISE